MAPALKAAGNRPRAQVRFYIACEVFSRYYEEADEALAIKLQRNIRRNQRVAIQRAAVLRLARLYSGAYDFAASILPRFIGPSKGRYVDAKDVRIDAFQAALRKRYPRESARILK